MKFSKITIDAFRWCSKLNPGLVLHPGQVLRTITSNKAVLLKVLIDEQLPTLCAINLAAFLPDLNTETDVNFDAENHIVLRNGRTTTKVPKIDPSLVMNPPSKELSVNIFQEKVFLHVDDLEQMPLAKRVSFAKHPKSKSEYVFEFYAEKEGAPIMLDINKETLVETRDGIRRKPEVVRTLDLTIPRLANQPFVARIKQSNLVLLPGSYEVEFSKIGVSRWSGVNVAASVWIAIESKQGWFGAQERDEIREQARLYMENAAKADLAKQQGRQLANEKDEQAKTSVDVKAA